ncbi:MAG: hypothetical protein KKG47_15300 [Proteobacteria bacterium]|nr:hypothetical protein [Pseudomonadota bacterium]MBU1739503.1 hypothetical protein [Pseudomonadota bacterium]
MKTYNKWLVLLSALLFFPAFAAADDTTGPEELEVTMTVVESPEDSPRQITNRIRIPTGEYLKIRERTRLQERTRATDSGEYQAEGAQEMIQHQIQTREMFQEQQEQRNSQIRENATGSMSGNGSGHGKK